MYPAFTGVACGRPYGKHVEDLRPFSGYKDWCLCLPIDNARVKAPVISRLSPLGIKTAAYCTVADNAVTMQGLPPTPNPKKCHCFVTAMATQGLTPDPKL